MNKKRWLDILNLLVERVPVTSETLAKQLQLSSKTVRTEMKELQKARLVADLNEVKAILKEYHPDSV